MIVDVKPYWIYRVLCLIMAEEKKTFIFYSDWINMVREMPDKDAGELLKHILSYVNDENPKTDNLLVKMAFGHMMPILKADLKRWESIRKKRKQAGAKGGKQTQANAKQMLANAKQVQAVNDNVNVSTKVDEYTPPSENEVLRVYNLFLENIKNDSYQMSVENWLRKVNGDKQLLNNLILNEFKTQLLNDTKQHKTAEKVKSHFGAWLNKYLLINAKS